MTQDPTTPEHVDVLVIGAGLSGIGAACQLRERHPGRSVAVIESRERNGGTWDLFRYPGVRSDSDMFTFGFRWRPWKSDTALADGQLILDYLRTVAEEYDVEKLIRYSQRVVTADWDSTTSRWTVTLAHVEPTAGDATEGVEPETTTMTCGLLWCCSGYYDYDEPFRPDIPGLEDFAGTVVHPQQWPEDLDYTGKKVVVIGSGATAVTLVPSMVDKAEHVTMLQRSPTYVLSLPARDKLARMLDKLPDAVSYPVVRWKNILAAVGTYQLARRRPDLVRRIVREQTIKQLPRDMDVDEHFKPTYNPWDQRLCFVPDGDLFRALRSGKASIVTDTIETVTPSGVRTASGTELEADIVITATGLKLLPFGGIELSIDTRPVELSESMAYRAMMLSGVPNFVYTLGYTNNSWTLKADLVIDFVCRLLEHMDQRGVRSVMAERDPSVGERPFLDLASGYVLRSLDHLPRQGDRAPWRLDQNYLTDVRTIRRAPIDDGVLTLR